MEASLQDLIEAQDMNALLRAVDSLCERRAWDDLIDLAERCEDAVERGKQLWPIAQHIDYRLALEAPGDYAAEVLTPQSSRFALGPLSEVAASTHRWEELAPHIDYPQIAAYVAQERVIRGEDLRGDARAHADALDMPLALLPWEPTYAMATFGSNHVEVQEPWEPKLALVAVDPTEADELDEPELAGALLDLVQPWIGESNGAAAGVVVEGDARAAASRLVYGSLRMGELTLDEAVQRMAWAAASGGAYGRRRGAALGRFLAFYTLGVLCDRSWPQPGDALGEDARRLRFYRWDEGEPEEGWVLRIAVEDPSHGWAAALGATDIRADEEEL